MMNELAEYQKTKAHQQQRILQPKDIHEVVD